MYVLLQIPLMRVQPPCSCGRRWYGGRTPSCACLTVVVVHRRW